MDDEKISLAIPWIVNEEKIVVPCDLKYWSTLGLKQKPIIIPQTWVFGHDNNNGNLEPFEFLVTDQSEIDNDARLMKEATTEFIAELYSKLVNSGLEEIFGLRRIHNLIDCPSWETTEGRTNILTFGSLPDTKELVDVSWLFGSNGSYRVNDICVGHCCHCSSC